MRRAKQPGENRDGVPVAFVAALRLLAGREITERQLRERLARQGHEPPAIDSAVARLRDEHAIDDLRVALTRGRTELVVRGRGRDRVRRQLMALGIDADIADEALDQLLTEVDERALVERAIARKQRHRRPGAEPKAENARLYRYLLGQGFSPSMVSEVLRARGRRPPDDPDAA